MNAGERGSIVIMIIMSILLLITLVGVNISGTSTFQMLMARNDTSRAEALEASQSAIDYTLTNTGYFIPNTKTCTANVTDVVCTASITLPTSLSTTLTKVTITPGSTTTVPVVSGTSADLYQAASFNIKSVFDSTSTGEGGKVTIHQGVIVIVPASH